MTDREKIIEIIESNKLCVLDMDCNDCPYKDKLNKTYSCGSYKLADTLIEAGIGDKSKHRLFISKDGTVCKQLYSGEEVEQIANERDEYKHRAEVAERQAILLSKWLAEKTRKDYPWQAWLDAAQKQAEREVEEECVCTPTGVAKLKLSLASEVIVKSENANAELVGAKLVGAKMEDKE